MVEFWACVGLACFDKEFFEGLRNGKEKANDTIREKMFRLSCGELTELLDMVKNEEISKHMQDMQTIQRTFRGTKKRWLFRCPPKPWPCPD